MTIPPPPPGAAPTGGAPSGDDKTMALVAHFGIIFFGFLAPLIVYLVKSDSPWAKNEGAKAFNFTIIFDAILFIGWFPTFLIDSGLGTIGLGCIFCFVVIAAWVARAVFGFMNGMKANNDEPTSYPFEIPLLK